MSRDSFIKPVMVNTFVDHVLELVTDTEKVKVYYMKKPGDGRMSSCLILFTPEGIVIQGDLTPGRNGVISCYGYGIGWFSEKKSEYYLCEKFLQKVFVPGVAYEELKEHILNYRREGSISRSKAREAYDELESANYHQEFHDFKFHEIFSDCFEDTSEMMGYDYHPDDAGWLCAIQHKFAELYQAKLSAEAV